MRQIPTDAVRQLRNRLAKAEGLRDGVVRRLETTRGEVKELEAEEELLALVAELLRRLIDSEISENVQAVEKLLTEGLQAVFEDMHLEVRADVTTKRSKVYVDLITVQEQSDGSVTEGNSLDAFGGSISTVQSVLMRVIVILRRDMRPIMLLDESLKAVADHYVPAVGRFLSLLATRVGMDVLAVSHNPTLVEAADKAYRIQKREGVAKFREMK